MLFSSIMLEKDKERFDMKYKTIIFDMDGTILDTVGDLQDAINYAMKETGHRHNFSFEDAKLLFGSGVKVAFQRALALENGAPYDALEAIGATSDGSEFGVSDDEVERIVAIYKPYYNDHCLIKTGPYPGINDVIKKCRELGIKTSVVSNKPEPAVLSLCEDLFPGLFDYAAGEKDGVKRKPAPDLVYECMNALGAEKESSVYVGDSEIDMQTAVNSGLDCISVSWGFRSLEFLKAHDANPIVGNSDELLKELTKVDGYPF